MADVDTTQVPVTFEDVAVYFCEGEWETLAEWQKELYRETMKENYETLTSLGFSSKKPSLISKIEREEDPCVRDKQDSRDRRRLRSCWRAGYGIKPEDNHRKGSAENWETHKVLSEKDQAKLICASERRVWKESNSSEEREIPAGPSEMADNNCGNLTIPTGPQTNLEQKLSTYLEREKNITRKDQLLAQKIRNTKKKDFQYVKCSKIFGSKSGQRIHSTYAKKSNLSIKPWGGKPFPCPQCGKRFHTKSNLKIHQKIHLGERPFFCSECGKSFMQKWYLKKHLCSHMKEKLCICKDCGKSFNKTHLKVHQCIHSREKPYACTDCGERFTWKSTLKSHQYSHMGEKQFACIDCGKRFNKKSFLIIHQKIHVEGKKFMCSKCGKRFKLKGNFERHQYIHTRIKPFLCTVCGQKFIRKSKFEAHQKIHIEKKNKPFTCTECNKRYTRKSKLKYHQKIHMGDKPFTNLDFGKRHMEKLHLETHQDMGIQPFSCTECGKKFNWKSRLKIHLMTHTGDKSFTS
ncbi:zinc finger protein OZF isoform X2 [Microcaecilia unicolor]|uniref:Zinc finger protein OZF-like isoform X2 n=1 Tax=Microcaecilia unicolor TaxID=1415580 RepID=A0A6P7XF69_9AMPH|nr:zinc finger protein OZF-like isoform X2 [Microcaecilia unicolor]